MCQVQNSFCCGADEHTTGEPMGVDRPQNRDASSCQRTTGRIICHKWPFTWSFPPNSSGNLPGKRFTTEALPVCAVTSTSLPSKTAGMLCLHGSMGLVYPPPSQDAGSSSPRMTWNICEGLLESQTKTSYLLMSQHPRGYRSNLQAFFFGKSGGKTSQTSNQNYEF